MQTLSIPFAHPHRCLCRIWRAYDGRFEVSLRPGAPDYLFFGLCDSFATHADAQAAISSLIAANS